MRQDTDTVRQKIAAARPWFPEEDFEEILEGVERILRSGQLILGENTHEFEQQFKQYVGAEHAVAVSSCSAALQIALRFFQIHGHEVILPTNNFVGVVTSVIYEGGTPVLADMNPETFCVDTEDVLARITSQTAGVIVVHIAGLVYPEIDRLRDICEKRGLFLIEDASHAHGATIDGRKAGSLTDVACFSFYPTKIMTTGTGGMITTRNPELVKYALSVRHHGVRSSLEDVVRLGNNWCLSEIHALLGLHQLRRLDENVEHRNRVVDWYRQGLGNAEWLTIPTYPEHLRHAYYKFPTLLREGMNRDQFRKVLNIEFRIENGAIYDPPCHLQPVFQELLGLREGMFPKAASTLKQQICPPIHSAISEREIRKVIQAMTALADRCRSTR